jgi:hypothetical protein
MPGGIVDVHVFNPSDPRLGRHQVHDERSRDFAMTVAGVPHVTVLHERHAPIWDQGEIGSCTANAALGMLVTGPLWRPNHQYTEADALKLYSEETRLDDKVFPGDYPPDDTGSTGLWSCKALQRRGTITSYRHAFGLTNALGVLARQPVSIGIPWYESFFEPNKQGLVRIEPGSEVAGGHQLCFDGIDADRRLVRAANSWTAGWGVDGWLWMEWDLLGRLLSEGGDVITAIL